MIQGPSGGVRLPEFPAVHCTCCTGAHSKPLGNHAFPISSIYYLCLFPAAVKSSNVLLTAQGGAKLCDVGLSHVLESMNLSTIACTGTFAW